MVTALIKMFLGALSLVGGEVAWLAHQEPGWIPRIHVKMPDVVAHTWDPCAGAVDVRRCVCLGSKLVGLTLMRDHFKDQDDKFLKWHLSMCATRICTYMHSHERAPHQNPSNLQTTTHCGKSCFHLSPASTYFSPCFQTKLDNIFFSPI